MSMQFESFQALIEMDGHGPYVWVAYGAFFLIVGLFVVQTVRQHRLMKRHLKRLWGRADTSASEGETE